MKQVISSRDWEQLSAYLDDALAAREARALEERLKSDAKLADGLEQLRRTRALLRSAPQGRPPRHFTLTEDMVGSRGGIFSRIPLSMRTVSAIASLLLVAVLVGDILTFGPPALFAQAPAAAEAPAEEPSALMAPAAESAAAEDQAEEGAAELAAGEARGAEEAEEEALPIEQEEAPQEKVIGAEPAVGLDRQVFVGAELALAVLALVSAALARRRS
jgi:anti-sigma factor RsiW